MAGRRRSAEDRRHLELVGTQSSQEERSQELAAPHTGWSRHQDWNPGRRVPPAEQLGQVLRGGGEGHEAEFCSKK